MKRSGFTVKHTDHKASSVKPTLRKCSICKIKPVANQMAKVCGFDCALILANGERDKRLKKEEARLAKLDREKTKERKDRLKSRSEWIAEVQVVFNAYIRARDAKANHGCIDCDKPFEPQRPGGSVDAGHYLSRGSAPHLRFNENNCFAQRKNCNRPGGTTREAFRNGVIKRIGLFAVESLESDQREAKWTIDDLKAIKATYKAKLKALLENDDR